MFRLQDNVPPIYVNESRDFQLLCRLVDCFTGGIKFDASAIASITSPLEIPDNLLELLATRVGFFSKKSLNTASLRYIIASFAQVVKYKGSLKGVYLAVTAVLKAEHSVDPPYIVQESDTDHSRLTIYTPENLVNKTALRELLRYVMPVGMSYTLKKYTGRVQVYGTELEEVIGPVYKVQSGLSYSSQLRGSDTADDYIEDVEGRLLNNTYLTEIVTSGSAGSDTFGNTPDTTNLTDPTE